jgi:hypothetical protein
MRVVQRRSAALAEVLRNLDAAAGRKREIHKRRGGRVDADRRALPIPHSSWIKVQNPASVAVQREQSENGSK